MIARLAGEAEGEAVQKKGIAPMIISAAPRPIASPGSSRRENHRMSQSLSATAARLSRIGPNRDGPKTVMLAASSAGYPTGQNAVGWPDS